MLPLGDATAIIGLYPAVTALLAWLLLRERLDRCQVAALSLAVAGGLLITKPPFLFGRAPANWLGFGIAALGCLLTSSQYLILRHPSFQRVHALQNLFAYLTLALPSLLVAHAAGTKPMAAPTLHTGVLAVLMGGLGMCAQGLIFTAAPHCKAAQATLIGSSEIAWSYVWQLALLEQPSDALSLLGALLILMSFALPLLAALLPVDTSHRTSAPLLSKAKLSELDLTQLEESAEHEREHLSAPQTAVALEWGPTTKALLQQRGQD